MKAEERQKRIGEHLQKVEFASLEELAKQVDASISTVRRDLDDLAVTGILRRTHGGARLLNPQSDEFAFSKRDTILLAEKEAIGKACASLIQPGQSVIVDAGSTVYHVAKHLDPQSLQIITNSLPVANLFHSTQQIEVIMSGGVIYPRLGVLVGPLAVAAFSELHADVAIMSGGGITPEGITNSHALLIDIQRAMIRAAGKVIFCLDHTKFGRRSVASLCDLSEIDIVVTDSAAPAHVVSELMNQDIEVIIAPAADAAEAAADTAREKAQSELALASAPITSKTRPARPAKSASSEAKSVHNDSSDNRMGWD